MTTIAVVQARLDSSRLPGKALANLCGRPMLWHVLARAAAIRGVDAVVLTTPPEDAERLTRLADAPTVRWVPHKPPDVLSGYLRAARAMDANVIIRLTGDCPLVPPDLAETVLAHFLYTGDDYWATTRPNTTCYPDGFDVEVFSYDALMRASAVTFGDDRQHVTAAMWLRSSWFRCHQPPPLDAWTQRLKLSVDTPDDLDRVRRIMAVLPPHDYTSAAILNAAKELGL